MNSAKAYLDSRGINPESIEKFQLGFDTGSRRLTIPYLTPAGPFAVKERCIADHNCKDTNHPKYLYEQGTVPHLFNAPALLQADLAVVVEGELDAISVDQLGLTAVAYPGTSTWKSNPCWRWCFDSLTEVVVVADGDDQGRQSAARVADSLRAAVSADVRVVNLPDGEDSNSYINRFGEAEYLEKVELL